MRTSPWPCRSFQVARLRCEPRGVVAGISAADRARSVRAPVRSGRGGVATEDADGPDHDELDDAPADERDDGGQVERGSGRMEGVGPENALERRDEQLAGVEDRRHEAI